MISKLKSLFLVAIVAGFTQSLSAQDIRVGVHAGFPVGDASDVSSFNLGIDGAVYFYKVKNFLDLGIATGYSRFFGKTETVYGVDFTYDDFGYIPIAASGRGNFDHSIFYTADIGYGIGLNNADGGLYYQGKIGWMKDNFDLFGFYRGISDNISVASIGVGVAYKLH